MSDTQIQAQYSTGLSRPNIERALIAAGKDLDWFETADRCGCAVTAVDLTEEYCDTESRELPVAASSPAGAVVSTPSSQLEALTQAIALVGLIHGWRVYRNPDNPPLGAYPADTRGRPPAAAGLAG
jgi:hypothetical protein